MALAPTIQATRQRAGLPQKTVASNNRVHLSTLRNWEQGITAPHPERLAGLARSLGVAPGALFCDPSQTFVGEVILTPESVAEIRAGGLPAAEAVAARLARRLVPLLLEAAQPPPQPKRRSRAEKLAQQRDTLERLRKRQAKNKRADRLT